MGSRERPWNGRGAGEPRPLASLLLAKELLARARDEVDGL
jgi:hypothetical protein